MFRQFRCDPTTSRFEELTSPELETNRVRAFLFALAPALIVASALSALLGMA